MEVGDIISFGIYDWRVLDIKNNVALVITDSIIDEHPYHEAYKEITWAECSLRKYLNGDFYNEFNTSDRKRINPVINKNSDNQWYGSKGGQDTNDKIFILSIEEAVCRYFGDSSSMLFSPGKNQKYWFQRKDPNNSKRAALYKGGISWWWLRSPGRVNIKAAYVHGDGNIGIQGNNIKIGNVSETMYRGGVRPALWLKLK